MSSYEARDKTSVKSRSQCLIIGFRLYLLILVNVLGPVTAHGQVNSVRTSEKRSAPLTPLYPAPCAVPIPLYARLEEIWGRGVDTTAYHPGKDTMHTYARERARLCAQSFGGISTRPWEQLDVARLQLALGNDSLARVATDRYLKSMASTPGTKQAWTLLLVVRDYLSAAPARFAEARSALQQLEALGRAAIPYRFSAYLALAEAARSHWNDSLSENVYGEILTQWRQLPQEEAERLQTIAVTAYIGKAEIAQRVRSISDARHIMDSARTSIPKTFSSSGLIEWIGKQYDGVLGATAPPISATWWLGKLDGDHTTRPRKGIVTVIQQGNELSSAQEMRAAARWAHRFGDKMELITLNSTTGWIRDTAPIIPKDEAEYRYGEVQRLFQLPGLMGIFETEYDWLRDGRRVNRSVTTLTEVYARLTIVDANGTIRYILIKPELSRLTAGGNGWDWEELIARKIEQLIAEGGRT